MIIKKNYEPNEINQRSFICIDTFASHFEMKKKRKTKDIKDIRKRKKTFQMHVEVFNGRVCQSHCGSNLKYFRVGS